MWTFLKECDYNGFQLRVSSPQITCNISKGINRWLCQCCDTIRYDTIRDVILTCARKPTWVSLIYRTEPTTKRCKTEKLKTKKRINSDVSVNSLGICSQSRRTKGRLQWVVFAEKGRFKPGIKEWGGDRILVTANHALICPILTHPVLWVALPPSVPSIDSPLSSSITPSLFHSGLNLPFLQILPTVTFLFFFRTDSTDSPDWVDGIMFSGCSSVCACVHACVARRRRSPTGLPSTNSFYLLLYKRKTKAYKAEI